MEQWKTNGFYDEAIEYVDKAVPTEEILKNDLTELFYRELELMIKQGEIIKIEIKAKPREGKSTEALALGVDIFELLKRNGIRGKKEEFGFNNIARDQQELARKMRDSELKNNILVVDEFNELEEGGENVTAEKQERRNYSDVQAGRYLHQISCSPQQLIDNNSDLILEIIPTEKDKSYITRNRLYYRFLYGGNMSTTLIGHVNIYVGDLIRNWEKYVKKIFYKTNRTPEDEELIKKWEKKDWYVKYMVKKFEKMELITKEGIFRPRELEYADLMLSIVKRLEPIAIYEGLGTRDRVTNEVRMEFSKRKMPFTILGERMIGDRIYGIINPLKERYKLKGKVVSLQDKLVKGKISKEQYQRLVKIYQETIAKDEELYKLQIKELEHYKEVNAKYHDI